MFRAVLIAAALLGASGARAEGPCALEAPKLCPGTTPGTGEFRRCLLSHRQALSPACLDSLSDKAQQNAPPPVAPEPPVIEPPPMEFIDTHAHLNGKLPLGPADFEGAAHEALSIMDQARISKALVMPPPLPAKHPNKYDFEDLIEVARRHPDRFGFLGGGGSLNGMIQEAVGAGKTSEELRKRFEQRAESIAAAGAAGFGEMTAEHFSFNARHPYESAPPDHPLFLLLSDIAARHGIPIDLHMEAVAKQMRMPARFENPPNPKRLRANIAAFERLLNHNPKAKIVWVHAGWDNTGDRTPALCRRLLARHPNLFMSLKSNEMSLFETAPMDSGRLKMDWRQLLEEFPDRFVLGSDDFYASPRFPIKHPPHYEGLRELLDKLPPELARKIAQDNAVRIYRLGKK